MSDTIFALSSGRLPSGVAVIRISGPDASMVVQRLAGEIPVARTAALKTLRAPDGSILDRCLVLYFPAPRSFTGEDCAEFHLHGGRAVVARMLGVLRQFPGIRQADPGEFTQRAFLNGKFDLVEVEALGDLINAETEAQRRFALENSGAAQSALYLRWRQRLLHARAMIEAELDFSDEGDVPGSVADAIWSDIAALQTEMREHIAGFGRAEISRDGYRVVLAGPPNAGKSSLINALAKRDVAIVSDEPGTTRDVLEVNLDLRGYKVILADTAGLRDNATGIEALGIDRTLSRLKDAHLVVELRASDISQVAGIDAIGDRLIVESKSDLGNEGTGAGLAVSVKTGRGLDELLDEIAARAEQSAALDGEILPSRERHVALFESGISDLNEALDPRRPLELRAESLRLADRSVGMVIGTVDAEDLLGAIFSQFCIGK